MHDDHRSSHDQGQRTDRPTSPRTWGENLGDRRRRRTVALVEARIEEILTDLGRTHPTSGLVGGAATCAEVRLEETSTTHRFIRIGLQAPASAVPGIESTLESTGWRRSVPGTDSGIIRMAHAAGRRPLFVIIDGPGSEDLLSGPGAPPPTSPEGRRIRARRLRNAFRPAVTVLSRRNQRSSEAGTDIETLEIQVRIVAPPNQRAEQTPP